MDCIVVSGTALPALNGPDIYQETSKEEELIEGEAKMENDLHTENKDDDSNDRSVMKEDQAAVGRKITSKLSKSSFRVVAVLILESDKGEEPLEGQTTKQDELPQGDQEASAEGEANNKREEELLGSTNGLDFKMLEREADDRYEDEFLLAYFLDDSSDTSNNSLASESESDRHGNPIDRYEDEFLLAFFLDDSSDTGHNSISTESESDRHGNPIDRHEDEFFLPYFLDNSSRDEDEFFLPYFLDNSSDTSHNSLTAESESDSLGNPFDCGSGNDRQQGYGDLLEKKEDNIWERLIFKREIKDKGFEQIQAHHALIEKLNQLEHANYTLAAKVHAYEEDRLKWEGQKKNLTEKLIAATASTQQRSDYYLQLMKENNVLLEKTNVTDIDLFKHEQFKLMEEKNMISVKLDEATKSLEKYLGIANEFEVQRGKWEEERNELNAKLTNINCWYYHYAQLANNYNEQNHILLEERNTASAKLVAANESSESYKARLLESEQVCNRLKDKTALLTVKVNVEASSAEYFSKLLHECQEKCRVLEEEKNELVVKLCTANASSELYQSLLHNLDIIQ
ncbi:uncharacterized protein LOC136067058 [Quercus suber]|uniref:uncharacterized protein LOC136067058 n=1 Tax=Quercus suber TaxID=58331 RepID=UPI0032DFEB8A